MPAFSFWMILVNKVLLYKSCVFSTSLANAHNLSNDSVLPWPATICKTVTCNHFRLTIICCSLVQLHILSNVCPLLQNDAYCKTLFPSWSLASNRYLFNSALFSTCLAHSHRSSNNTNLPSSGRHLHDKRPAFLYDLWKTTIYSLTRLCLVPL